MIHDHDSAATRAGMGKRMPPQLLGPLVRARGVIERPWLSWVPCHSPHVHGMIIMRGGVIHAVRCAPRRTTAQQQQTLRHPEELAATTWWSKNASMCGARGNRTATEKKCDYFWLEQNFNPAGPGDPRRRI
jgi:hypothetical protein